MPRVASNGLRELNATEIEQISGGYSYETCVLTWSGIGTFMGAVLGGGIGAAVGGLGGSWYGTQVCQK